MTGARAVGRGGLLDATVVVVLVALILSILDDSYSDRSYLVAGLVPTAALVGLAFLTRRIDDGGWWYALGAAIGFAPLGALFALREPGPYFLPTVGTMIRVMGESIGAPGLLVSTVPPADAEGQVLLVPFVIAYFSVGFAVWLALGTRSSVAPAVPLVLAMAGAIPLGVQEPRLLVARGMVLAVVLVVWVSARARRNEPLVGRPRGQLATTATALVIVVLVSFASNALVPDRDKDDRVLLRTRGNGDLVSGAAGSALPPQVGGHVQLLRATGVPAGHRLRFAVLDQYDGNTWVPADLPAGSDGFGTYQRIGKAVTAVGEGTPIEVRVQLRPGYSGDWLPLLGDLTSLDLDESAGRSQLEDVRYNQVTSSAIVVGGVDPRDNYIFDSILTADDLSRRDPTQDPTVDQQQPAGAFLDQYLEPFRREELRPVERVLLLARYLRLNGLTRYTGSPSLAPVDLGTRLLGSPRMTATPFQYTGLVALGAARLGVPARVVTGAEPGARGVVEIDDVTSWVELQFADGTWRTLDPTRYVGMRLAADTEVPADPAVFVDGQLEAMAQPERDAKESRIPEKSAAPRPEETAVEESLSPGAVALRVLGLLVALAALALLVVPLVKWLRRGRRRRTSSWSGVYVNGWQEVLDAARDCGTPVPDAWSRVAQATRLGGGLDLARRCDAAVFAPQAGVVEEGRAFWDECQDLRRHLVAGTDARRRAWSHFNPASLVDGWARRRTNRPSAGRQVGHEDRRPRGQQPAGA